MQKGVHKFTGFTDKQVPFPNAAVTTDFGQFSADHGAGILSAVDENGGEQRGGGGFPVGAADADGVFKAVGDGSQHHRALHRGDIVLPGIGKLTVVLKDGGAVHHQVRPDNILRLVSHRDSEPHSPLHLQNIALVVVRTGDDISFFVKDLDDGEHSGTADPNEMQMFFPAENPFLNSGGVMWLHIDNLPVIFQYRS